MNIQRKILIELISYLINFKYYYKFIELLVNISLGWFNFWQIKTGVYNNFTLIL